MNGILVILVGFLVIDVGICLGGWMLWKQYRLLRSGGHRCLRMIPFFACSMMGLGIASFLTVAGCLGYQVAITSIPPAGFPHTGVWIEQSEVEGSAFRVDGKEYRNLGSLLQIEVEGYFINHWNLSEQPREAVFSGKYASFTAFFRSPKWVTFYRIEHDGGFELIWDGASTCYYRAEEERAVKAYLVSSPDRYYLFRQAGTEEGIWVDPSTGLSMTDIHELPQSLTDLLEAYFKGTDRGEIRHMPASNLTDIRYLAQSPMDGILLDKPLLFARTKDQIVGVSVDRYQLEKLENFSCAVYLLPKELEEALDAAWED